jgi:hypothetical protein
MRILANSEKTPCPALLSAEGQPRAKQQLQAAGVCNEQVPGPKGKVCSDLHRNMESAAEMIAPVPHGTSNNSEHAFSYGPVYTAK